MGNKRPPIGRWHLLLLFFSPVMARKLPLVINTWKFTNATAKAYQCLASVEHTIARLDAIEKGCSICELQQCDFSVGYGSNPDSTGEVTLDAMIMDGPTHDVGAVGYLRRIRSAISVARAVLEHTKHSLIVGEGAKAFAKMMGFTEEPLNTERSDEMYKEWKQEQCQPNYYLSFENVTSQCPPYTEPLAQKTSGRLDVADDGRLVSARYSRRGTVRSSNHDTIGMIVVDANGDLACGTSTNGLKHKVAGRVGDSPLPGAGCYVDNEVGGAAGTGDGDVMLRFSPAAIAVEGMRYGLSPQAACEKAIRRIADYYPLFTGGLICANKEGDFGAASWGWILSYAVQNPSSAGKVMTFEVAPVLPNEAVGSE